VRLDAFRRAALRGLAVSAGGIGRYREIQGDTGRYREI